MEVGIQLDYQAPDGGQALIHGFDVVKEADQLADKIAVIDKGVVNS